MQFERIDVVNLIIVIGLVASLIFSILYKNNELAMNISAGLIGFLGGITRTESKSERF